MSLFKETLKTRLGGAGIEHSPQQLELCEEYYRFVVEANAGMNLTRITGEIEAAERHFADAMLSVSFIDLPQGCKVIDIGSGAGFPGIPVKILRPDIDLTLLDSSGKKTDFLKHASEKIGVSITVINVRAEEAAKGPLRESFYAVFSRAVAPLNMLIELCAPFVSVGGVFAAWKGAEYKKELGEASAASEKLGLLYAGSNRIGPGALLKFDKQSPTPKQYPRRFARIKASPL